MKKITNTVSSILSRILAGALVLVGFGCSSDDDDDDLICMYGTPQGTFEVKGSVTAANDDSTLPVEAKVIVTSPSAPYDATYNYGMNETSANGQYLVTGVSSNNRYKVVCLPNDPDLEPDSVEVDAKYASVSSKRNFWMDMGHASVSVDFKLKEKKTEE